MDEINLENVVQQSTRYDKFKFLTANREQNRGHVEALKKAFTDMGNLTMVQPILVNDRFEIIDGQHRFVAAQELGEPIYFTVRSGLQIADARNMNILHRSWTIDDYAQSYADQGDPNYVKYLQIREDYGFGHSTTVMYIAGGSYKGQFVEFRKGEFTIEDEAAARSRLDKLTELLENLNIGRDKALNLAILQIMGNPAYKQERMVTKAKNYGDTVMRHYGTTAEYLRALEELYNYRNSEGTRVRLY